GKDLIEVPTEEVRVGDRIVIFPHELCPVDGVVVEGEGTMDESFLTGEPFLIPKTTGSDVISGAINGESALSIEASRVAIDSRYAKIMKVMQEAEQNRPALRRLGDMLGAYYTPLALAIAGIAYLVSGDPTRFLAVLVVATPCPLLLAIPITIIGSISLAAQRGIVVKRPAALEQLSSCRSIIFDKTGTLTYGRPELTEILPGAGFTRTELLAFAASVERYSKHPLSSAILLKAHQEGLTLLSASEICEKPGRGLQGVVSGKSIEITSRSKFLKRHTDAEKILPAQTAGLECVILINDVFAGLCKFRDSPRLDSKSFIDHLAPKHSFKSVMLVSGDRESEVRYLAERVGITQVFANQSPEDKVAIVQSERQKGGTLFIGDGINDAPAIAAATVGIAFGQGSEILTEAADAVIMEPNLSKVDELFHIAYRMRHIALQSAIGGMALSIVGMGFAVSGHLSPVAGAIAQEVIDLLAVLNAIRVAVPPTELTDFSVVSQTKT
ncbi:MAG: cadmium-translocating P-type ATPase, partial [Deltaproteobacteria bacterium]|nr:cadmium-translocating P-type ATPase [Deltaproteobacteria bacterium]